MEAALADARRTLERLQSAKAELGMTGSLGNAAIARMRDSVAALEDAREAMIESHQECYTILKSTNIRGVASSPTVFPEGSAQEQNRAA
jgi:hypothetical protein